MERRHLKGRAGEQRESVHGFLQNLRRYRGRSLRALALLTATAAMIWAPSVATAAPADPDPAAPVEPIVERVFQVRGVVKRLAEAGDAVVVRHEEIPGFMPRMTMEFRARHPRELTGLAPGDPIEFQLIVQEEESWIERVRKTGAPPSEPMERPAPTPPGLVKADRLAPGAEFPDLVLIGEDGSTRRLSDFEGRAVAFTMIFTRCPAPEYCPRMNRRFQQARAWLQQRPETPTNWQFLSVSFDPEFDQPEVLRRHASAYRGESADRWLFAAAPAAVLEQLGPTLDFRFSNGEGGWVHNLRTVVLDPRRRLFRVLDGNSWTAEELAGALAEAAQQVKAVSGTLPRIPAGRRERED